MLDPRHDQVNRTRIKSHIVVNADVEPMFAMSNKS